MTTQVEFARLWAAAADRHQRGDAEGAILHLCRAILLRREDVRAQGLLCRLLLENPGSFQPSARTSRAPGPGLVSVVVCSIDSRKFERVRASYARAFGDSSWELIGIHDARSLAEGYMRGFSRARGEVVVFSHDDIEILSDDLAGALARALALLDVVGVVGTTRLTGPAHAWSGTAHARGRIVQRARAGTGVELVLFNMAPGVTTGLQAIDGVFMAAKREVIAEIGFDSSTFDRFHMYDLDFSYRAHLAGRRVGVTSGIVLRHDSEGSFDAEWKEQARRFLAKFPGLRGNREVNELATAPFADAGSLLAFCERLDEAFRQSGLA